jgi:hypothetical protein
MTAPRGRARAFAGTRPTATTCHGTIPADIQMRHRTAEFRFEIAAKRLLLASGLRKTEYLFLSAGYTKAVGPSSANVWEIDLIDDLSFSGQAPAGRISLSLGY